MITIEGTIVKIFASRNNSWASIIVKDKKTGKKYKAAGCISNPIEGYNITMTGEIQNHDTYGEQFMVAKSKTTMAKSSNGIMSYLSSGFVEGVGSSIARSIVETFGSNALDIITKDYMQLVKIKGISARKAKQIHDSHIANQVFFELVDYFNGMATDYQIRTIYDKYGKDSVRIMKENPYKVIYDIKGFGFKKADKLAEASGIKRDDPKRIAAAITYVLNKLSEEGHCYCNLNSLEDILAELIQKEKTDPVPVELISDIIVQEIKNENLFLDGNKLYLKELYFYEVESAGFISDMIKKGPVKNIKISDIDFAIETIEHAKGFSFELKQRNAVSLALKNRLSVITGGPGTGKSTIVECIIEAWENPNTIVLMAPTGKAARRLNEITDVVVAETVHKTIARITIDPYKYQNSLFIVDEGSMLSLDVFYEILRCAYKTKSAIVFIGDIDQLPPIGPGNAFRDLVQSVFIPTVTLELSHRSKGSIAINANKINKGDNFGTFLYDESFILDKVTSDKLQETVLQRYMELIKEYDITDICCLVPTRISRNNDTKTCSEAINKWVQNKLNPISTISPEIKNTGFRINDRVMYKHNNYDKGVFNGDCGIIIKANLDENEVIVKFDSGEILSFTINELSEFVLAYAMTVHKSQGSEYKAIVLAQGVEHYTLLQRNLLYTGVTRAKEKVIIVAEPKALCKSIKTIKSVTRRTQLIKRIAEKVSLT